jgi:electron-transferring-flavoprotein dehydrogenase
VRRNVTLADMVRGYGPNDWDRVFRIGRTMLGAQDGAVPNLGSAFAAGIPAVKLYLAYRYRKYRLRGDGFVQLPESAYRS